MPSVRFVRGLEVLFTIAWQQPTCTAHSTQVWAELLLPCCDAQAASELAEKTAGFNRAARNLGAAETALNHAKEHEDDMRRELEQKEEELARGPGLEDALAEAVAAAEEAAGAEAEANEELEGFIGAEAEANEALEGATEAEAAASAELEGAAEAEAAAIEEAGEEAEANPAVAAAAEAKAAAEEAAAGAAEELSAAEEAAAGAAEAKGEHRYECVARRVAKEQAEAEAAEAQEQLDGFDEDALTAENEELEGEVESASEKVEEKKEVVESCTEAMEETTKAKDEAQSVVTGIQLFLFPKIFSGSGQLDSRPRQGGPENVEEPDEEAEEEALLTLKTGAMVSLMSCRQTTREVNKNGRSRMITERKQGNHALSGERIARFVSEGPQEDLGPWERFELICVHAENKVAFRRSNGQKLLRAWPGGSVKCDGDSLGRWETFEMIFAFRGPTAKGMDNDAFYLKTSGGKYLSKDDETLEVKQVDEVDATCVFCLAKRPTNWVTTSGDYWEDTSGYLHLRPGRDGHFFPQYAPLRMPKNKPRVLASYGNEEAMISCNARGSNLWREFSTEGRPNISWAWSSPLPQAVSKLHVSATTAGPGSVKVILCAPVPVTGDKQGDKPVTVFSAEFGDAELIDIGAPRCATPPHSHDCLVCLSSCRLLIMHGALLQWSQLAHRQRLVRRRECHSVGPGGCGGWPAPCRRRHRNRDSWSTLALTDADARRQRASSDLCWTADDRHPRHQDILSHLHVLQGQGLGFRRDRFDARSSRS